MVFLALQDYPRRRSFALQSSWKTKRPVGSGCLIHWVVIPSKKWKKSQASRPHMSHTSKWNSSCPVQVYKFRRKCLEGNPEVLKSSLLLWRYFTQHNRPMICLKIRWCSLQIMPQWLLPWAACGHAWPARSYSVWKSEHTAQFELTTLQSLCYLFLTKHQHSLAEFTSPWPDVQGHLWTFSRWALYSRVEAWRLPEWSPGRLLAVILLCVQQRTGCFLGDNSSIKGRHATTEIDLHIFAAP